jgi:hypothetical protein
VKKYLLCPGLSASISLSTAKWFFALSISIHCTWRYQYSKREGIWDESSKDNESGEIGK